MRVIGRRPLDFEAAAEYIKDFYSKHNMIFLGTADGNLNFATNESRNAKLIVSKDEINDFRSVESDLKLTTIGEFDTCIVRDRYVEQLLEPKFAFRGIAPWAANSQTFRFEIENPSIKVEIGKASALFMNFFRFRNEKFISERIRWPIIASRSTSISDIFNRLPTIRITYDSDSPVEAKDINQIFNGCLFELSYLKNRIFELRSEWPTLSTRPTRFRFRPIAPGATFPFKNLIYDENIIRFYQRALSTDDAYIQFLSYYHIMEYFFINVNDRILYDKLSRIINDPTFRSKPRHLDKIIVSISDHKKISDETEMLKNVLKEFVSENEAIEFISDYEKSTKEKLYSERSDFLAMSLDRVTLADGHVLSAISKRIKSIRNCLIHSSDRYERNERYIPSLKTDDRLRKEIPLLQFLAEKIIIATAMARD